MQYIQWKFKDVIAGTTLRNPNAKENGNLALHACMITNDVIDNRKQLSEEIGIDIHQWVFAKQTHSDHIHKVVKQDMGKGAICFTDSIEDCDALYTKEKNIGIGVFHADCVPVLLYDPYTEIIAAIHSGWQGTVKEITRKTLEHLITREQVDPKNVKAYIGPAIGYRSFEIGEDVIKQIKSMSFDTSNYLTPLSDGKALADNKGLNVQMLLDLGVPKDSITINPNDTFLKNDAFFSYRRDHQCGRHLSFIYRK